MLHDFGFLDAAVELDGLTMLCFSAGAGFILFVWLLCGVIFRLFLQAMQKLWFIYTSCLLAWRFCPGLASAALLEVGRQSGCSSLSFPEMIVIVGILSIFLRRCFSFDTCSDISISSNLEQVSLELFISKYHPCRQDCFANLLGTACRSI